ncbi:TPA: PTS fructose transporter subunit IIB [Citrobacter braakii]|jgi:PTS system fructose-specific IIB component|uniref:protein-N(pi)-phosphohistidine--D-fructose phosphotransferase n=1 Tax=Citrobacter braakii TaxID=57706 RepID=A0A1R0FVN2_CITBR|nr:MULTISPECIES: fructose PTS transporter subunit IIB [Citrobacter]KKC62791.1 PTS fructose transporter subunit IIB [Citrobacter amalonaticus]MBA7792997.1 PTS fructose transporter subunit IIB [Citrobacter sp. RHBSTW-01065]MCI1671858.1 fructose PTS transporter subunit IIB [Citrobacter freundii]TKV23358.1 PTS fructose transporter subunit IIB [Citrobacter sp. TBCS-11]ASE43601.1 PTS fructose transporter subunit IIB [Citrobacter braakii]
MNIVCVAACTAGIAHTYIAREKLIKGAKALGHNIRVETQGTIGTENELLTEDISAADVVILAVDVKIKGEERFLNKRIVRVKTEIVIKSPIQFLEKVEKSLVNNNQ